MLDIALHRKLHGATGEMVLDVKLQIEEGSFTALAGESGSGKTTLLRILAGLEKAQGRIVMGDEVWLDGEKALPPQKRSIGFVFQEYALFANMTVLENLLFVQNDTALAGKLLALTQLSRLRDRMPTTLSGGQQQRVALCRALMRRPRLLLMDEPLSALDPQMRQKLQHEIGVLHREFGTTTLMVSHDPSEIYRLAERVAVLERGSVVREGAPAEILLQTQGSRKFAFEGELLDLVRADLLFVAVIAIGQQLVEVTVSAEVAKTLQIGDRVEVSTKAFAPMVMRRDKAFY